MSIPLEFFEGDSVQELPGLGEGKPEILERDDPVQLSQLIGRVAAIAGFRVDLRRTQQPDLVVVPERANGDRSEPGELADAEHDTSLPPSRSVRVKALARRLAAGQLGFRPGCSRRPGQRPGVHPAGRAQPR
jgi:hypothetical protein